MALESFLNKCECGGEASCEHIPTTWGIAFVVCKQCGKQTPIFSHEIKAVDAWNKRS